MSIFPTIANARPIDPMLMGITMGLFNSDDQFIADRTLNPIIRRPSMEVDSGQVFTGTVQRFVPPAWFGRPAHRGDVGWGAEATKLQGVELDPLTYRAKKYFYRQPLPREMAAQTAGVSGGFSAALRTFGMAPPVNAIRLEREIDYAALFFNPASWLGANNLAIPGGSEWNTAGGTPMGDITTVVRRLLLQGVVPDSVILGADTVFALSVSNAFNNFRSDSEDRSNLPVNLREPATPSMIAATIMARFPSIKRVQFGLAVANTSNVEATFTPGFIWNDSMFIGKLDGNNMGDPATGNGAIEGVAAFSVIPEDLTPDEEYYRRAQSYEFTASMHDAIQVGFNRAGALITNTST
jgi:hypothetical protein